MSTYSGKQLATLNRSGTVFNSYYLYGNDSASVKNLELGIIKKLAGDDYSKNIQKYDASESNLDLNAIYDEAQMYPFGCEYNIICIEDYNASKRKADENKIIQNMIKDANGSQTIIILAITSFDVLEGKSKIPASSKNKKIIDLVSKNGAVGLCNFRTESEVGADIVRYVKKNGGNIKNTAAVRVARYCLCMTEIVKNETDKLIAYANGDLIDEDMVEKIVTKQEEEKVYALSNAITKGDLSNALHIYHVLSSEMEPDIILYNLTDNFINLYRASAARRSRKSVTQIVDDFDYRFSFTVQNAIRDCGRFTSKYIRKCINLLRDAQIFMNSESVADRNILIEETIVKIMTFGGNS